MKGFLSTTALGVLLAFAAGFISHVLYQRWNPANPETQESVVAQSALPPGGGEAHSYRVSFAALPPPEEKAAELAVVSARDVVKIRGLAGQQGRIRGRVFRVSHSAKSNTFFLNFGPSREALTAVIFASAAELFEKKKLPPKNFEGRDVELIGAIKDHPQYGLEIVLETPEQIKIVD